MLIKIAWKNIWRNPVRSIILIVAITLGIWALIFINGVSTGMVNDYIDTAIQERTSHIQIHLPEFVTEPEITGYFETGPVTAFLSRSDFVGEYSSRIITSGMISSTQSSRGITLYGIDPEREAAMTGLDENIAEGEYLKEQEGNYILLGDQTAEKLGVKIRSRVVVNFQNAAGEVTAAAFRVAGIVGDVSSLAGDNRAYIPINTLRMLTGLATEQAHEIALLLKNPEQLWAAQDSIQAAFPELTVQNYLEIAPDVALMGSQIQVSLTIMTTIFMLALIFGIINTMLMAVLERYRELGMLLAVGMKKFQVFIMVVWETIFISLAGMPIGILLGAVTISLTHRYGINLEKWSDSLTEFGLTTIIHPELSFRHYLTIGLAVLFTAVLASIYPARKATSLNPIEALRKI